MSMLINIKLTVTKKHRHICWVINVVFLYIINSKVSIRMTHATYGPDACGTVRCVACCVSDVTARVQHGRPPVVMEALIKVLWFDTGGAELLLMSQPGMAAEVKSKARLKQQLCMMGLLGLSSRLKPDQHTRPSVSSVCWNTTVPRWITMWLSGFDHRYVSGRTATVISAN